MNPSKVSDREEIKTSQETKVQNKLIQELTGYVNGYCRTPKAQRGKGKVIHTDKVNLLLTTRFGLVTDDNEHDLGFCRVNFDWNLEKWYVFI